MFSLHACSSRSTSVVFPVWFVIQSREFKLSHHLKRTVIDVSNDGDVADVRRLLGQLAHRRRRRRRSRVGGVIGSRLHSRAGTRH